MLLSGLLIGSADVLRPLYQNRTCTAFLATAVPTIWVEQSFRESSLSVVSFRGFGATLLLASLLVAPPPKQPLTLARKSHDFRSVAASCALLQGAGNTGNASLSGDPGSHGCTVC